MANVKSRFAVESDPDVGHSAKPRSTYHAAHAATDAPSLELRAALQPALGSALWREGPFYVTVTVTDHEQALAPGEKRVKADWENIYIYGMGGSMALGAVLIYFKPDNRLDSWATKQAKARMIEQGTVPTYTKSSL